ncbi:hypothetical protein F4604DRAFT_1686216 [Suillus subluteus]|nr:hypothetical protein F4604DRAFT_1686216 [Suillus subluteus]
MEPFATASASNYEAKVQVKHSSFGDLQDFGDIRFELRSRGLYERRDVLDIRAPAYQGVRVKRSSFGDFQGFGDIRFELRSRVICGTLGDLQGFGDIRFELRSRGRWRERLKSYVAPWETSKALATSASNYEAETSKALSTSASNYEAEVCTNVQYIGYEGAGVRDSSICGTLGDLQGFGDIRFELRSRGRWRERFKSYVAPWETSKALSTSASNYEAETSKALATSASNYEAEVCTNVEYFGYEGAGVRGSSHMWHLGRPPRLCRHLLRITKQRFVRTSKYIGYEGAGVRGSSHMWHLGRPPRLWRHPLRITKQSLVTTETLATCICFELRSKGWYLTNVGVFRMEEQCRGRSKSNAVAVYFGDFEDVGNIRFELRSKDVCLYLREVGAFGIEGHWRGRFESTVAPWETGLATLAALATSETLDIKLRDCRDVGHKHLLRITKQRVVPDELHQSVLNRRAWMEGH